MRPGRFHPGNPPAGSDRRRSNRSFNEAGAFPPRKCNEFGQLMVAYRAASMRPGRFHPGNVVIAGPVRSLRLRLQ